MSQITEKLEQIKSLNANDPKLSRWLKDSDAWCWIYSALRISGQGLPKGRILDVLNGKIIESLPLDTYSFIHNHKTLLGDMELSRSMQASPDAKLLERWHQLIYGPSKIYRDANPMVYEWNYVPPHFGEIKEFLPALLKSEFSSDPVENAALTHLGICRIYPYGRDTATMALALTVYQLTGAGYPVPEFSIDDREYNNLIETYLLKHDEKPFIEMMERAMLNRLESVYQVSLSAKEAAEAQKAEEEAKAAELRKSTGFFGRKKQQ